MPATPELVLKQKLSVCVCVYICDKYSYVVYVVSVCATYVWACVVCVACVHMWCIQHAFMFVVYRCTHMFACVCDLKKHGAGKYTQAESHESLFENIIPLHSKFQGNPRDSTLLNPQRFKVKPSLLLSSCSAEVKPEH